MVVGPEGVGLSTEATELPDRTEVLVIGSGFGGSVVAAELATAGTQVCVVERGNEYPPGSFPRGPAEYATNFWDPHRGLFGMFDVWTFRGLETVVASGLGGGSLIYANVMLRKPATWFRQPHPYRPGVEEQWSFDRAALEPHYDAVEDFLRVQKLPTEATDDPLDPAYRLPKTLAFAGTGNAALAPLAVQFRNEAGHAVIGGGVPDPGYPNLFGAARRTCRLCGECDVGCNDGAKNSMDHTYLSLAKAHRATLHTRTKVTRITRGPAGGFEVAVKVYPPAPPGRTVIPRRRTIIADRVVLAAGTLGSGYLMLRNREHLGLHNPALGSRFCGNGDLLGFILGAAESLAGWRGPVITSYLEFPDQTDTRLATDLGMYIQDAGYPEFAAWLTDTAASLRRLPKMAKVIIGEAVGRKLGRTDTSLSAELSELLGRPTITSHGLPVLGMGMDVADGTLFLQTKHPKVMDNTWSTASSAEYFDVLVDRMRNLAAQLGGRLTLNPTYRFRRVISVHPLGGCPADTDHSLGVVDGMGRVRGVPGMRICDGSVFPGPVGANPSLTIAAFARRVALDMRDNENTDPQSWPQVGVA